MAIDSVSVTDNYDFEPFEMPEELADFDQKAFDKMVDQFMGRAFEDRTAREQAWGRNWCERLVAINIASAIRLNREMDEATKNQRGQ